MSAKTIIRPRADGHRRGRNLMLWLLLLLFLDVCTTVVGLSIGLRELNPLVSSLMRALGLNGLVLSKLLATALAAYFLYSGRMLLLRRATLVMGVVVSWNLFWLVTR